MPHVVIDTDIGTDVDDALALFVALGAGGLELVGVTTVYVDAPLRQRLARALLDRAGAPVPVVAGRSHPIRPVPERAQEGHWEWHEGRGVLYDEPSTDEQEHLARRRPAARPYVPDGERAEATDFLQEAAQRHADLHVICIGPLTNIAAALAAAPEFGRTVGRLVVMGGHFGNGAVEHNFTSDVGAAEAVLSSDVPITLLPLDVSRHSSIAAGQSDELRRLGSPAGDALATLLEVYLEKKRRTHTRLHDPLAVLLTEAPSAAKTASRAVEIDPQSGRTSFAEQAGGRIDVVEDVWLKAAHEGILQRLHRAAAAR